MLPTLRNNLAATSLTLQFVESKAFQGGPQGVAELAEVVDLGAALTLRHMALDCLKDPKQLPVSAEAAEAQPYQPGGTSGRGSRLGVGACCAALPGCGGQHRHVGSSGSGGSPVEDGGAEELQRQQPAATTMPSAAASTT